MPFLGKKSSALYKCSNHCIIMTKLVINGRGDSPPLKIAKTVYERKIGICDAIQSTDLYKSLSFSVFY